MKRLLNTLFVTTEGAWLRKDGANAVVEIDGAERARTPVHLLGAIVCFGRVGMSPPLLGFCAEQGIAVTFLTDSGRFLARMEGPTSGNVLLRRAQHAATFDPARAVIAARAIVAAKAANTRVLLRRAIRDFGADAELSEAERRLGDASRKAGEARDLDIVRGLEGEAANAYFAVFDRLIRRDEPELRFAGRSRRPPKDAPNALLSFTYVLLAGDCRAAAETVGLDPQMGFLHRDRPGRPSLALDLMEEFRAIIAERVVLTLLNRRQLDPKDFETRDDGSVLMTAEARKAVLVAYQERKRTELTHPFLKEKMALGLALHVQAQLMSRWLRGDLDGYPPYLWM